MSGLRFEFTGDVSIQGKEFNSLGWVSIRICIHVHPGGTQWATSILSKDLKDLSQ